ncbi:MAG: ATPase, T2SS/T4P/T4SS family [Planctomycetota bacterium]|jgi:type IV pilus assembly protein PilB
MAAKKKETTAAKKKSVRKTTAPKDKTAPQAEQAPPAAQDSDILTMEQAIELLKTTRPTFYRWLRSGKVKGMKVGRQWRFQREDIERFMKGETPKIELTADIKPLIRELQSRMETLEAEVDGEAKSGDEGVVQAVNLMITLGVEMGASDIHMAPLQKAAQGVSTAVIRYRVDGMLLAPLEFDLRLLAPIAAKWRSLFGGSLEERVKPQDGRIMLEVKGRPIDLRVSVFPVIYGDSITARILNPDACLISLDRMDYSERDREKLTQALDARTGLILVTGPTGSGKTTNLYACIDHVSGPNRKTVGIEDPVEYSLPWVEQIPVRPEHGMGFPPAIRATLRQAPDTIMVGELRDQESLELAQQAALTGHLILTTMHTNDAASTLIRMVEIGAQPFLIGASVTLVTAQRLARCICPDCREEYSPNAQERDLLETLMSKGMIERSWLSATYAKGKGCARCSQTGYRRRTCLSEMLEMTAEIRAALQREASAEELKTIAIGQGMTPMLVDGIRQAAAGKTTLEEVIRVAGSI